MKSTAGTIIAVIVAVIVAAVIVNVLFSVLWFAAKIGIIAIVALIVYGVMRSFFSKSDD